MSYELRQFVESDLDKIIKDLDGNSTSINALRYWIEQRVCIYWAIDDTKYSYLIHVPDIVETGTVDNKYLFYFHKLYHLTAKSIFTTEVSIAPKDIDPVMNIDSLKNNITEAFKVYGRAGTSHEGKKEDFDNPFIPVFSN